MTTYPLRIPAIKVKQKLDEFFAVAIPASVLLDICYPIKITLLEQGEESPFGFLNKLSGTQREQKKSTLKQIQAYSETVDATFPNSIILGANYDDKTGLPIEEDDDKWYIEEQNNCYNLIIPSNRRLASIIDGQHRLYGFQESSAKDTELLCSVFLDLPMPYHAKIFMNINMNQRRVDKNLAYNLFHFEIEPGDMKNWAPDTLSVYFARILATKEDSPFNKNIKMGLPDEKYESTISFSSVIDGILGLITTNAKQDRDILHKNIILLRDREQLKQIQSRAPLRELYIYKKDKTLYSIIFNFINAFTHILRNDSKETILNKTLGIQTLFDFLKIVLSEEIDKIRLDKSDISAYAERLLNTYTEVYFSNMLQKAQIVNFSDEYFGVQTKARTRVRNVLLVLCYGKTIGELKIRDEKEVTLLEEFIKKASI